MSRYVALARNDLRTIRRDATLTMMFLLPIFSVALLRALLPALTDWATITFGIDLRDYTPAMAGLMLVLSPPLLFGTVAGFMLLDERDDDTLTALRVTPVTMTRYVAYRFGSVIVLSALYVVVLPLASGLVPLEALPRLAPVALGAGMVAPAMALFLVAFASNKVEGLALTKAVGLLMLGPLAAYLVAEPAQNLFGVLPTYWPAKAFWIAIQGGNFWPYLVVAFAYPALLSALLFRLLRRRL